MNITLFGAAFDPPHVGHAAIVYAVLQHGIADQVWLVPVKEHEFGKKLAPEADRLQMVSLLAEYVVEQGIEQENVRVETYELDQPGVTYTHQTLRVMANLYPQHHFSFVIGSDNLERFHEWGDYQQMLSDFPFFVYPRAGYPLEPLYDGMQVLENVEPVVVSSTHVRAKVRAGESIAELVPAKIAEYVQEHELYGSSNVILSSSKE